jgi:hypothetical protein
MNDNKKNIKAELSEIAPFLASLKKEEMPLESFQIPDDYFNQLSKNIFDKTILAPELSTQTVVKPILPQKNIRLNIGRYFQWLWNPGVAVVMTSVVILVISGIYLTNQKSTDYGDNLTTMDIEQYIEANIDNFDLDQLASLVADERIEDFKLSIELPVELPDIESKAIEEYIEENFIEDLGINDLK